MTSIVCVIISIFSPVTRHQITQKGNETFARIMINHFRQGKSQPSTLKALYKTPWNNFFQIETQFFPPPLQNDLLLQR